jgi:2-amino-4-hydroxy-6-hydroxymethyldihydropteridine diphosphokinase
MAQHPLVAAAASGRLPEWAVVEPNRLEHVERVVALLDQWAAELRLAQPERDRWRAAGYLHDALRDAAPEQLRPLVPGDEHVPDALLHGPAAAELLKREGVDDEELLTAIAYHTLGERAFGALGRALYCADFLEPGRTFLTERRAELRARMPDELDSVVRDVARERIRDQVARGLPLNPRTVAFWNALVGGTDE